jgi:hypothetical protein
MIWTALGISILYISVLNLESLNLIRIDVHDSILDEVLKNFNTLLIMIVNVKHSG